MLKNSLLFVHYSKNNMYNLLKIVATNLTKYLLYFITDRLKQTEKFFVNWESLLTFYQFICKVQ